MHHIQWCKINLFILTIRVLSYFPFHIHSIIISLITTFLLILASFVQHWWLCPQLRESQVTTYPFHYLPWRCYYYQCTLIQYLVILPGKGYLIILLYILMEGFIKLHQLNILWYHSRLHSSPIQFFFCFAMIHAWLPIRNWLAII